jgi:CRP-like cAMP-binding protein
MTAIETLQYALHAFAKIDENAFELSADCWHMKHYQKGAFFNEHRGVCRYLGFVTKGAFRSYVVDEKSADEKNIFFYSQHQFVVTFKSFINQIPCTYHTCALVDSEVICICIDDLLRLYKTSHTWETFGRLLAQEAFNVAMGRTESFLFKTPEERYLDLERYYPDLLHTIPLYHLSSYLGIKGPSLSRIRRRLARR